MELKAALNRVKVSKKFEELNKNQGIFLSFAMKMIEEKKDHPWQLGYFNKSTNKVATFVIEKDSIQFKEEEDVFKKPDTRVKEIEIDKVKLSFNELLKKAEEFQKKKYSKELVNKKIAILQNIKEYGTVWNVTFLTHAFNTLNMKLNAKDGKILHHSIESLLSFIKK